MKNSVKILSIQQVTHDVKCFRFEKPAGYQFLPGQVTDVSVNKPGMEDELRPFTFTALTEQSYLEFTIKRYDGHHGITDRMHQLVPGDELIIREAWGAITYKGPGYFIAGGAGITPFMAILRSLHQENKIAGNRLFFSNKTEADIIYKQELVELLGDQVVFILTREDKPGYQKGHIDEEFIKQNVSDFGRHFYACGPDQMVIEIAKTLQNTGAETESILFEK